MSYPTTASTTATSITVRVPPDTVDGNSMALTYNLVQGTWSNNKLNVDIQGSSGTTYARTVVNAPPVTHTITCTVSDSTSGTAASWKYYSWTATSAGEYKYIYVTASCGGTTYIQGIRVYIST